MKTSQITGISRLTKILWRVRLECGHSTSVTREELERQQLFIGKTLPCLECLREDRKKAR